MDKMDKMENAFCTITVNHGKLVLKYYDRQMNNIKKKKTNKSTLFLFMHF